MRSNYDLCLRIEGSDQCEKLSLPVDVHGQFGLVDKQTVGPRAQRLYEESQNLLFARREHPERYLRSIRYLNFDFLITEGN